MPARRARGRGHGALALYPSTARVLCTAGHRFDVTDYKIVRLLYRARASILPHHLCTGISRVRRRQRRSRYPKSPLAHKADSEKIPGSRTPAFCDQDVHRIGYDGSIHSTAVWKRGRAQGVL